mmetsp:Transcript_15491/g.36908  ORF Transcript_15491/g.36908 Transcript_15491/m.36908 type:complete len:268 (-) Transcript_15491:1706-2509(-)
MPVRDTPARALLVAEPRPRARRWRGRSGAEHHVLDGQAVLGLLRRWDGLVLCKTQEGILDDIGHGLLCEFLQGCSFLRCGGCGGLRSRGHTDTEPDGLFSLLDLGTKLPFSRRRGCGQLPDDHSGALLFLLLLVGDLAQLLHLGRQTAGLRVGSLGLLGLVHDQVFDFLDLLLFVEVGEVNLFEHFVDVESRDRRHLLDLLVRLLLLLLRFLFLFFLLLLLCRCGPLDELLQERPAQPGGKAREATPATALRARHRHASHFGGWHGF